MTLTSEAPRTLAPPPPAPRPRRWPRRLVLGTVVGLAVVMLAAYVFAAKLVWLGMPAAPEFTGAEVVSLPTYGDRGTDVLMYEHDRTLSVEATVSNDGLLPVTLEDVRFTDEPRPLLVTVAAAPAGGELPVTLGPGESVRLRMDGRLDNCRYYHEREAQTMGGLLVDVSILGRQSTETVALAHDLVVRSPMIVDCPDRTLRRGDDVRR